MCRYKLDLPWSIIYSKEIKEEIAYKKTHTYKYVHTRAPIALIALITLITPTTSEHFPFAFQATAKKSKASCLWFNNVTSMEGNRIDKITKTTYILPNCLIKVVNVYNNELRQCYHVVPISVEKIRWQSITKYERLDSLLLKGDFPYYLLSVPFYRSCFCFRFRFHIFTWCSVQPFCKFPYTPIIILCRKRCNKMMQHQFCPCHHDGKKKPCLCPCCCSRR